MVGSPTIFFEWFNYQQPVMTWNIVLLGSAVLGGLAAGIRLAHPRTPPRAAATHWHRYVIPALVLLTLAMSIGTAWSTVATQQFGQRGTVVEATPEAVTWDQSPDDPYPLRVDTDAGELFSISGF